MKSLDQYVIEKLKLSGKKYKFCPKNKPELVNLMDKLRTERGEEGDFNDVDTSNIKDMMGLFSDSEFNGDISEWNVSNVTNMQNMFNSSSFNGDISNWDVSNVKNMNWMFMESYFNQDISGWDVSGVEEHEDVFLYSKCEMSNQPKFKK